jgi:hypothetical protein
MPDDLWGIASPVAESNVPGHASDGGDYSKGTIRRHSELYIETGDLVIQVCDKLSVGVVVNVFLEVEKAIFRIHRHFLGKHSPVLNDMLQLPTTTSGQEATDQNPLVLSDQALGWELFLGCFYRE